MRKKTSQSKTIWFAKWRASFVLLLFALAGFSVFARAVHLQILDQEFLVKQGEQRYLREVAMPAHRGPIVDRYGQLLAVSTPVDSVWMNPAVLAESSTDAELERLATLIKQDLPWLKGRIAQNLQREFVYLRRHMNPAEVEQILVMELPGVHRTREYRRFYPAGEVTGHLLGFTDIDDQGLEGLELAYNHHLRGTTGKKRVLQDRYGQTIEDIESITPALPGQALATSIDLRLQYVAYRALKSAVVKYGAESGSLVMLDVQTGEVLALVNQPGFNPNDRTQLKASRYRNRAVTDIFEPGSSFKPLVMAAALENNVVKPTSIIHTEPGYVMVGQFQVEDTKNLGAISATRVLTKSSNVGMSKIALDIEPKALWSMLSNLGFGQLTNCGFPGESAGLLNSYAFWQPIHQATLSYGYGLSLTPLQLVQAYAAIGAGGVHYPISFVQVTHPPSAERVMRASTAQALTAMLETVVGPDGTGHAAAVPGYSVAGKTGTAHKVGQAGYTRDRYTASFAGFAPAEHPRLAMVVVIHEPAGDTYYGGAVAAPVFQEVMAAALRTMAIAPDKQEELMQTQQHILAVL